MTKLNNQEYPIMALREELRGLANEKAHRLPCPEYGQEVRYEQALAEELFYLQRCRAALETCIHTGSAVLRYPRPDGTTAVTKFRMVGPSRVRLSGFAA